MVGLGYISEEEAITLNSKGKIEILEFLACSAQLMMVRSVEVGRIDRAYVAGGR